MNLLITRRLKLIVSGALLSSTACSEPPPTKAEPSNSEAIRVASTTIKGVHLSGWEMPSLIRLCTQDRHLCEEYGGSDGYCSIEFSQIASQQFSRLRVRNRVHQDRPNWIEGTGRISPPLPTNEDRRECHVIMTEVVLVDNVPLASLRRAAAKRSKEQEAQSKAIAAQKPRSARPLNASNWVTDADYPLSALRDRIEGTVRFRVSINHTGSVRECWITSSSGSTALDLATCELVSKRAQFEPAMKSGAPVEGSWSGAVRWATPRAKSM